jgi:hypothetical protein
VAQEIYDKAEARGKPVVQVRVRRLPSNPRLVAGDVMYRDPVPQHQVAFHKNGMPMKIERSLKLAGYIARRCGVDYVWIDDLKGLIPEKSGTLLRRPYKRER